MRRRDILVGALTACLIGAVLAVPAFDRLRGLSIDLGFWLRYVAYGQQYATGSSPAVIVASDEESYRTRPFADRPVVLWTPQIAAVLNAVIAGGAKVVGFDVIMPQSVEAVARGYDRDFLLALRKAGGSVVSGGMRFCTTAAAFEIKGNENCAARGLTESGFATTATKGVSGYVAHIGPAGLKR